MISSNSNGFTVLLLILKVRITVICPFIIRISTTQMRITDCLNVSSVAVHQTLDQE